MDQLRADAHQLEQFDGIDADMAQMIRLTLAYVSPFEEPPSSPKHYDAWSA